MNFWSEICHYIIKCARLISSAIDWSSFALLSLLQKLFKDEWWNPNWTEHFESLQTNVTKKSIRRTVIIVSICIEVKSIKRIFKSDYRLYSATLIFLRLAPFSLSNKRLVNLVGCHRHIELLNASIDGCHRSFSGC